MSSNRQQLVALARRRGRNGLEPLDSLRTDRTVDQVSRDTGLPRATISGIQSFYDLLEDESGSSLRTRVGAGRCVGTACRFSGGKDDAPEVQTGGEVYCLGRCYAPPAIAGPDSEPIPRVRLGTDPIVLRNLLGDTALPLEDYRSNLAPQEILGILDESGLRGRGGAAYPTGAKWRAAREAFGKQKIVVANGDEGDPGSYIDRLLLEEDPHSVLAGMKHCATAIGATRGFVFIRGEYPAAASTVEAAISEARNEGWMDDGFAVEVRTGAGSYVCGEESALLRAIEGLRAEPSPRPPYPTSSGLWGLPTVVQNVETLSMVPWLLRHRHNPYRKAICISGAVAFPGVVEIDLGTSLQEVLVAGGGGPAEDREWQMALVGGPMGRVVAAEDFANTALDFDSLPGMGHGGTVVFDNSVQPKALAEHLFNFARRESCGNCTPCRVGTAQLHRCSSIEQLKDLLEVLETGSLCGFGRGVPQPIRDLIELYGGKVFRA